MLPIPAFTGMTSKKAKGGETPPLQKSFKIQNLKLDSCMHRNDRP
jgi:hypothetical protein